MVKVKKYTGTVTYMYPSMKLATPDVVLEDYPAILAFPHIVVLDEGEQMIQSIMNLSMARSQYKIESDLSEDQAIAKIEEILNTPEPEPEEDPITPEERIAAALEYQNLVSM